jgi:hypothetical protein
MIFTAAGAATATDTDNRREKIHATNVHGETQFRQRWELENATWGEMEIDSLGFSCYIWIAADLAIFKSAHFRPSPGSRTSVKERWRNRQITGWNRGYCV